VLVEELCAAVITQQVRGTRVFDHIKHKRRPRGQILCVVSK